MEETEEKKEVPVINDAFLKKRPLSYSSIKRFGQSPLHYIHYLMGKRVETPALIFGTLVDLMLFTPEEVPKRFVIPPEINRRSNAGKAEWAKWVEDNADSKYVTQEDFDKGERMVDSLKTNPLSAKIINDTTTTQRRLQWNEKKVGTMEVNLPFVGYLDGEVGDEKIWDLKTTTDAHPDKFMRDAFNYGYHIQAAMYLKGIARTKLKFPDFYHVVVEKSEPYGVSVHLASNDFKALGKQQYEQYLMEFRYCMEEQLFHQSYEFRAVGDYYPLDLPGYAKMKLDG